MYQVRTVMLLLSMGLLIGCASAAKNAEEPLAVQGGVDSAAQLDTDSALADSTAGSQQNEVEEEDEVYCTMVKPTGSRIPVRYCRTRSDDKKNREVGRGMVDQAKKTSQNTVSGG